MKAQSLNPQTPRHNLECRRKIPKYPMSTGVEASYSENMILGFLKLTRRFLYLNENVNKRKYY